MFDSVVILMLNMFSVEGSNPVDIFLLAFVLTLNFEQIKLIFIIGLLQHL